MAKRNEVMCPHRVLVTGGGTGIGLATVEALIEQGLDVVAVGRREAPLLAAEKLGATVFSYDVRADPEALLDRAGVVDGLVLNAGIQIRQSIEEWTEKAWTALFKTNLLSAALLVQAFVKRQDGPASIVGVASTLAQRPAPNTAAYGATKAGLIAMLEHVAQATGHRQIRANIVLPGVVQTEMVAPENAQHHAALKALHPLGRIGQPREVAQVVVDVLRNPWMTGAQVPIDGGLLLGAAEV